MLLDTFLFLGKLQAYLNGRHEHSFFLSFLNVTLLKYIVISSNTAKELLLEVGILLLIRNSGPHAHLQISIISPWVPYMVLEAVFPYDPEDSSFLSFAFTFHIIDSFIFFKICILLILLDFPRPHV